MENSTFELEIFPPERGDGAVMVPFGYPKNYIILEACMPGSTILFADGSFATVSGKTVVNTGSPMAQVFARMIYGKDMASLLAEIRRDYGDDVYHDRIIVLSYERA